MSFLSQITEFESDTMEIGSFPCQRVLYYFVIKNNTLEMAIAPKRFANTSEVVFLALANCSLVL